MTADPKMPTHSLVVKLSGSKDAPFCTVGVAWPTKKGGFKISLNVGTSIDWRMLESYTLFLLPKSVPMTEAADSTP